MSRGLGKLQRYIKQRIEEQGTRWDQECDRIEKEHSNDEPKGSFWLTWSDIRIRLYKEQGRRLDWDKWLTLERAAKRALYTLHKRGEVGRIKDNTGRYYLYITAKTYERSFSRKAMKELGEAMERFTARGKAPARSAAGPSHRRH